MVKYQLLPLFLRLFLYYHTLANNKGSGKIGQRAWFYFPLFYFFESNVDGRVPNVFEWPLTLSHVSKALEQVRTMFLAKEEEKKGER